MLLDQPSRLSQPARASTCGGRDLSEEIARRSVFKKRMGSYISRTLAKRSSIRAVARARSGAPSPPPVSKIPPRLQAKFEFNYLILKNH